LDVTDQHTILDQHIALGRVATRPSAMC